MPQNVVMQAKVASCVLAHLVAGVLCAAAMGKREGEATVVVAPGLEVRDGVFFKGGRPLRAMGINYFSCFLRLIEAAPGKPDIANRDYAAGFEVLRGHGIPFVRFAAGGFFPVGWKAYLTDREGYFKALDGLVAEAERQGMGLIPSLFWTYSTVPDVVGETLDQWGNPGSKTHAFLRQYTTEVVSRYKDSPAVWGWEFGNEYIHEADLPPPEFGRGWIVPHLGTPSARTEKDKMFRRNIHVAYREFGKAVREIDKTRPIFTGDAMQRPCAWHNWKEGTWTADTPEQWAETHLSDNPLDTHTAHFYYYDRDDSRQDMGVAGYDVPAQMAFLMELSRRAGKPLFLGEFGQKATGPQPEEAGRRQIQAMIDLIVEKRVPLSALWNYDCDGPGQEHCNITPDNRRAWTLAAIGEANRRMAEEAGR
jgi:hypothetical protein